MFFVAIAGLVVGAHIVEWFLVALGILWAIVVAWLYFTGKKDHEGKAFACILLFALGVVFFAGVLVGWYWSTDQTWLRLLFR